MRTTKNHASLTTATYFVYIWTDAATGKRRVGSTSNLAARTWKHLHNAEDKAYDHIEFYRELDARPNDFTCEVLAIVQGKDVALGLERQYREELNTFVPNGYDVQGSESDTTAKSARLKGRKKGPSENMRKEGRERIAAAEQSINVMYGEGCRVADIAEHLGVSQSTVYGIIRKGRAAQGC